MHGLQNMIILTSHSTSSAISHSLSSELIAARLTQAGEAEGSPLLFLIEPDRKSHLLTGTLIFSEIILWLFAQARLFLAS